MPKECYARRGPCDEFVNGKCVACGQLIGGAYTMSLEGIKTEAQSRIRELKNERSVLVDYLTKKTDSEDWHAVADAAMDLREIDRELAVMKKIADAP